MLFESLRLPEVHEHWEGLVGASIPLSLAELMQSFVCPYVVVASDAQAALRLYEALRFLLKQQEVLFFPDWETLPYDRFSPYQDLVSERLSILNRLSQSQHLVIVTTATTLMQRLPPGDYLSQRVWIYKVGQILHLETMSQALTKAGYQVVDQVTMHGEYAVRGNLIDVFPMGQAFPFRLELFDDVLESIRTFDPDTQCTLTKLEDIYFLPAREFPMDDIGMSLFRKQYRETFGGKTSQAVIYEAVSEGRVIGGVEYYFPLFFEKTATFFDYLHATTRLILLGDIHTAVEAYWKEIHERYDAYRHDVTRPLLPPQDLFIVPEDWKKTLLTYVTVSIGGKKRYMPRQFNTKKLPEVMIQRQSEKPLAALEAYLTHNSPARHLESRRDEGFPEDNTVLDRGDPSSGFTAFRMTWRATNILFIAESLGRQTLLLDLLTSIDISPILYETWQAYIEKPSPCAVMVAPLDEGVEIASLIIITETELFGEQVVKQRTYKQKSISPDLLIRNLIELKANAPVVHLSHGVGRYLGLKTLEVQGVLQEFIELAYQGGDKIYVPVTDLHLISRYAATDIDNAPLHQLGHSQWAKAKQKAVEKINDSAVELLEIYAKRQLKPGLSMRIDESAYAQFAMAFSYTETADQIKASEDILQDLQSKKPMDRLICGDVGFGKTEVAMRAAFVAVSNGKQVCVLVPTTLLASQHFETFSERFAAFPIKIGQLSRFQSEKVSQETLTGIARGTVDIVIGTHKLFKKNLPFKDLGLLIIDEEHRFGVKQKEHIKALRHEVHCLAMTATPIPRTLNLSLAGLRDISLIATPPARRLAIKTFWREKSNPLIREAVLRELLRGGQVFYLHNHVETIAGFTESLVKLLPEAKIQYAHGQMPERELSSIMSDFYHQRFQVLVSTTIIETGIDIPTANTMIIERADLLGLAQLHQLRGRVGRSHHQAYAYLLTPPEKTLTQDAVKRLEAIVSLEALGSGFLLASQDLEIRGAGELLGEAQSGNMHEIGFNLYMDLLERAVKALKEGKEPALLAEATQTEIEIYFSALIPESYVFDVQTRLVLYKRIGNAASNEALDALQVELIDRFGLLPQSTQYLFEVSALKLKAKALGIHKIQLSAAVGKIIFSAQPSIHPDKLIQLIQAAPARYRLTGTSLSFQIPSPTPEGALRETAEVLQRLV